MLRKATAQMANSSEVVPATPAGSRPMRRLATDRTSFGKTPDAEGDTLKLRGFSLKVNAISPQPFLACNPYRSAVRPRMAKGLTDGKERRQSLP
jgi:hypothetical protein